MMEFTLEQLLAEKARREQLRAAAEERSRPAFAAPAGDPMQRAIAVLNAPKLPGFGGEQITRSQSGNAALFNPVGLSALDSAIEAARTTIAAQVNPQPTLGLRNFPGQFSPGSLSNFQANEGAERRRSAADQSREEFPECDDVEASDLAHIAAGGAGGAAGAAACSATPGPIQGACTGAGGVAGVKAADYIAQANCRNEAWKAKYCVYKGKKTLKNVGEEGDDIVIDDYDCSSYHDRN